MGSLKPKMSMVYVVYPIDFNLNKYLDKLLKDNLIVCANVMPPIKSHYRWKGKSESSRERAVIFKILDTQYKKLKKQIEKDHPYEVCFIGKIEFTDVNRAYLDYACFLT